jgi:hypothetical protein
MVLCVGLAVAVVAVVAVPARREGRELLSPQGEEIVASVKERTEATIEATVEKTNDVISATRDKVGDTVQRDSAAEDAGQHRAG